MIIERQRVQSRQPISSTDLWKDMNKVLVVNTRDIQIIITMKQFFFSYSSLASE